jgi:hypothetical protein
MRIATRWIKNLSDTQQKKEFLSKLIASRDVLKRLQQLLQDDISAANKKSLAKEGYETNNWAYHQADLIGEMRAYTKIIKMIDLPQEK